MSNRFRLEGELQKNIGLMGPRHKAAMVAGAKYIAPQAEGYMKQKAPWTDRTGNARQGLTAQVVVDTNKVAIVLFHQVPYGIWLELKNSGQYQIIRPTIQVYAQKLVEAIGELMFK